MPVTLTCNPPARGNASSVRGHVVGAVGDVEIDSPGVEAAEEGLDVVGEFRHPFWIAFCHLANGSGPGGSVGDGQHAAQTVAVVGVIAVKHLLVDHHRGSGLAGYHAFFRMVQVTGVGIAVAVQGQVGPRDHFEGRAFRSQIVQIVEDPSQYRGAGLNTEDFGAVGLGVGMDHDSRMPRMRASVAAGGADECVAE